MTAMSPGVIADSIVNLCGALGLCVAMFALYRRDPRSPLTQRLLLLLGVVAVLFFARGVAWWTGSVLLDRLSLIPAALVPLGALIVTEGILRRHAPRIGQDRGVGRRRRDRPWRRVRAGELHHALRDRAGVISARGICDLRVAAGDAGPHLAAGLRKPQHRPRSRPAR